MDSLSQKSSLQDSRKPSEGKQPAEAPIFRSAIRAVEAKRLSALDRMVSQFIQVKWVEQPRNGFWIYKTARIVTFSKPRTQLTAFSFTVTISDLGNLMLLMFIIPGTFPITLFRMTCGASPTSTSTWTATTITCCAPEPFPSSSSTAPKDRSRTCASKTPSTEC